MNIPLVVGASVLLFHANNAIASPVIFPRQSISPLTTAEIDAFTPYTWYASASYCEPADTQAWNCGVNCEANPTFKPVASGGDGDMVQFWYVGYDPTVETVIVAHQGTNVSDLLPILTDLDFFLVPLKSDLLSDFDDSIEVHMGFKQAFEVAASDVLTNVKMAIQRFDATKVTVVGHSLGSAIALLDAVYLPTQLPSYVSVDYIGYGTPRVGNQAFVDYVDANIKSVTRITNKKDIVPILPGMFLGFHHVFGEDHITDSNAWVSCPGEDNESLDCSTGEVPNIFVGNSTDHTGPYNGIVMQC